MKYHPDHVKKYTYSYRIKYGEIGERNNFSLILETNFKSNEYLDCRNQVFPSIRFKKQGNLNLFKLLVEGQNVTRNTI